MVVRRDVDQLDSTRPQLMLRLGKVDDSDKPTMTSLSLTKLGCFGILTNIFCCDQMKLLQLD